MPNRLKASGIMPRLGSDTFLMRTPLPTMAAMPINEPTSIMSGSMVWLVPCSESTPSMVSRFDATPLMRAPMLLSIRQSCWM